MSQIEKMFDSIASDYDRLNHILSLGIDRIWRRRALKYIAAKDRRQSILDIACGTGDFTIEIAEHTSPLTLVHSIDISEGMLKVMEKKVSSKGLDKRIRVSVGNCEEMQWEDNMFDVVTIGFGIRNFENRGEALREILRVLKPGGRLVILELSIPEIPVIKGLYLFYFNRILPFFGGWISGNRSAYRYLPASVIRFPKKKEWMSVMEGCGYNNIIHKAFSLGICRMYVGEK